MKFQIVKTSRIIEHPRNREFFNDIADTNPAFWREFVDSIREFGILEPLIVNGGTMQVRSGNQRLKAAIELGLDEVPVLWVDPEDSDEEIRKMIASNVFRRTIDPFAMFEYIGRLRKGGRSIESTRVEVRKRTPFVSAADIFNDLPKEQQAALREWFTDLAEGEKSKTEGELIAMIKALEVDKDDLEERLAEMDSLSEQMTELQRMIDAKDIEIDAMRNTDFDGEIQERDVQIQKLMAEQTKLEDKIKDLKESPDINFYLADCVKKQKEINAVLKEVIENADSLNQGKLEEFSKALKRTIEIVKKGVPENSQDGTRELLSD